MRGGLARACEIATYPRMRKWLVTLRHHIVAQGDLPAHMQTRQDRTLFIVEIAKVYGLHVEPMHRRVNP